jgi:glycerol uptake facilitator-like aquaporin
MIQTYQIVVLMPYVSALLLVAIPGYRIGSVVNVLAAAVTFAAGLWLLVGGERGVGDYAIVDEFNIPPAGNLGPLLIGLLVGAIGASFGANAGYAINPARDFGPRLFTWIAGWGKLALPGDYGNVNTYFWIPIIGPLVGAAIACYIYDFGIRDVLVARGTVPEAGEERGEVLRETPADTPQGLE